MQAWDWKWELKHAECSLELHEKGKIDLPREESGKHPLYNTLELDIASTEQQLTQPKASLVGL